MPMTITITRAGHRIGDEDTYEIVLPAEAETVVEALLRLVEAARVYVERETRPLREES